MTLLYNIRWLIIIRMQITQITTIIVVEDTRPYNDFFFLNPHLNQEDYTPLMNENWASVAWNFIAFCMTHFLWVLWGAVISLVIYSILKIVFLLVAIAYFTIAERKVMGAVQRRKGPNVIGFWGLLQPLADGAKLMFKELLIPTRANNTIFLFAPIMVLVLSIISWSYHSFRFSSGKLRSTWKPFFFWIFKYRVRKPFVSSPLYDCRY